MRILWIASNGGLYNNTIKGTGGWIPALQEALSHIDDIELGIVFVHPYDCNPVVQNNIHYFPIKVSPKSRFEGLIYRWFLNNDEEKIINQIKKVVDYFHPNLVHIWGVENYYAKVVGIIDCPCVAHIQGLISSCIYHYLPPAVSIYDLYKSDSIKEKLFRTGNYYALKAFRQRLKNEEYSVPRIKFFMGRTSWDKDLISYLNPNAVYFHCDEMLRQTFYEGKWEYHYTGKLKIQSSISVMLYKGFDIILKTAQILRKKGVEFEWRVFGVSGNESIIRYFCKKEGIDPNECSILFKGSVDEYIIKESLLESDVYVHPSYIENSSNAIGEAMMLGVPVIAQDVGGNSSMLLNDSGVVVPANEPILLASKIEKMKGKDVANYYSVNACNLAMQRHDKKHIVDGVISIYREILNRLTQ